MKLLVLNHQLLGGRGQLTEPESVGSNVNRTPDHASSSEFFSSNPHESRFEEIRDNEAILPSEDVGVACQLDCQQALALWSVSWIGL